MMYRENLTVKAKSVYQCLAFHSNKENKCFPALKTIARECSISVSSVQRGLRELLDAGLIRKKHNYRANGSQTSNIYELIIAVEERAQVAKENTMQRIHDMKKRMECIEAKKRQIKMKLDCKEDEPTQKRENTLIASIVKLLKISHLTRGDSQIDRPGTLKD